MVCGIDLDQLQTQRQNDFSAWPFSRHLMTSPRILPVAELFKSFLKNRFNIYPCSRETQEPLMRFEFSKIIRRGGGSGQQSMGIFRMNAVISPRRVPSNDEDAGFITNTTREISRIELA